MPTELQPGEVVSYMEMCSAIGVNLQRGMNFRLKDGETIKLIRGSGLSQTTVYKILQGKPVRRQTLTTFKHTVHGLT